MLIKMAKRNIFRHRRRTLLTSFMMVLGYIFISFSVALVEGGYGDIINLFTSQYTGHAQIHNKKYIDSPTLNKTISGSNALVQKLKQNKKVKAVSRRVKSGALAFAGKKTLGVEVVGIDAADEKVLSNYHKRVFKGADFSETSEQLEALVGKKAAESLKLKIGDEIVLISQGADGSIANDIFKVNGFIGSKQASKDDYKVYIRNQDAFEFYSLYGRVHEIPILLKDFHQAASFSSQLELTDGLAIRPWQMIEADFYKLMETDKKGNNVTLLILIIVVAVGVLNTVLMSTLERTREFGVLKALGTSPKNIFSLVCLEGLGIATISVVIGTIISLALNYYLSVDGINVGEVEFGGMVMSEMKAAMSLSSYLIPTAVIYLTTFLVCLYPAIRAAKMQTIDALRDF